MVDRDIGEMFLNFMLSKYVRPYFGVNIGQYPTIKLGTRKLVSKRIIQGIDGTQTGMRTQ